jgi:hypothetical protein
VNALGTVAATGGMTAPSALHERQPVLSRCEAESLSPTDRVLHDSRQCAAFDHFVRQGNPTNGLRADTSRPGSRAIVGRCAGERINSTTLAMGAGLSLHRLAWVNHAYPTQSEAVRQAAQACAHSVTAEVLATNEEAA